MVKTIEKRDGTIEGFHAFKIENAIKKAYKACDMPPNKKICSEIANIVYTKDKEQLTIEEIQSIVEEELMHKSEEQVAKAYIIYRSKRDKNRKMFKTFNELVDTSNEDIKIDNANMNGNTPAGQMMKFASVATVDYAEEHLISQRFVEAKNRGDIYYHDSDYYVSKSVTCTEHDLKELYKDGFYTEHGFIREPNRLTSAIELAAISLQTNQNLQHGGQAIACWDNSMVPYAKISFEYFFLENYVDNYYECDTQEELKEKMKEAKSFIESKVGEIELSNQKLKEWQPIAYRIAKRKLIRESDQAHEGFVFNMNTMHSRGKYNCFAI